jgi:hypothetical protein
MSDAALDTRAFPAEPSFLSVLWSVLLGYVCASITLAFLYLPLYVLGFIPRPFARPGPFPIVGAWSLDADLVVTAVIVLVAAWWIRSLVANKVGRPVSSGVVALIVGATGYAPFLALRPAALSGFIALPATTWLIRRYAVDTMLPFAKPSWRLWLVFVLVGVAVYGSYQVYHPLVAEGGGSASVNLWNPGWVDLTILHVDGGWVGDDPFGRHDQLPHRVRARAHVSVWADAGRPCVSSGVVTVTFSVLGRTSTQAFATLGNRCSNRN